MQDLPNVDNLKNHLRHAHDRAAAGLNEIVSALVDLDGTYMDSTIIQVECAAKVLEEAARRLRDEVVLIKHQQVNARPPPGPVVQRTTTLMKPRDAQEDDGA